MTPKLIIQLFIIALSVIFLSSCSNDSVTNTQPTTLKGAYLLYENAHLGGSDYCYVDIGKDTVLNNVYESANGVSLLSSPGNIKLKENKTFYILCGGPVGAGGKMYEINEANNQVIKSLQFGNNPRNYAMDNGLIFATSSGGSYTTEMDLNLNVINDYVDVGPNPGRISFTSGRFFVCKADNAIPKQLAVINEISVLVTQVNLNFLPMAMINNTHGYYITGKGRKYVYHLDSVTLAPIDSIAIPTSGSSAGDIIKEGELKALVAVDSSEVWELNFSSIPPTIRSLIAFPGGRYKISGLAYENVTGMIYVADNQGGPPYFGIVHVYDPSSGLETKSYSLLGRNPIGFAFKY